jgi:hypothetical protein
VCSSIADADSKVIGRINKADDYRTLLADGVVGHESKEFFDGPPERFYYVPQEVTEAEIHRWADALVVLAEADGLRAELAWNHMSDIAYDPCVVLIRRNGSHALGPNVFPHDQALSAEWHRPVAEAEWREKLEAARRKAGISRGKIDDRKRTES